MKNNNFGKYVYYFGPIFLIPLVFFMAVFGFKGTLLFLLISLFYFLPTYILLKMTGMDEDEKIVSSFFLGLIIFPTIVYYLGFLISFKISIMITAALLTFASVIVLFINKKNN